MRRCTVVGTTVRLTSLASHPIPLFGALPMTRRVTVSALVVALAGVVGPQVAADESARKAEKTLKVGVELPVVVTDFVAGPHKGHCGCPAIMISNEDARGLVIWARTAEAPAVQLAAAVDGKPVNGKKVQGYLIVFDTPEEKVATAAKGIAWKGVTVGKARDLSDEVFTKWQLDPKAAYAIFLVDRKEIKALWVLPAAELTKEKSEAILKEATAFLKEGERK